VFPDVITFLEDARKRNVRLYLLSFGDPDWQRHKVTSSRLDSYFDGLFFIPKEGGKARLILEQTNKVEQIVLIDNNPEELDLLKDAIPTAKTYFITRVPDNMVAPKDEPSRLKFFEARRYLKRTSRYKHITCTTLDGIFSS
jgi:methionine salvage enolase-phosphatase E1